MINARFVTIENPTPVWANLTYVGLDALQYFQKARSEK
jgi:hypothetical protein